MGKKTHGPYLIAAIEANDIKKVSDILSTKFRDKSKVKTFLVSDVKRLASEFSEVPLLLAATLNDPSIIEYMVQKHEANINYVHEYGAQKLKKRTTALLVAVKKGLYATVDAVISLNANVNFQDYKGRSPLHHAIRRADYRMAKLLLSRGAQVALFDVGGNSPLHVSTIYGHSELIKLLMRYGGDLYKKGQHGAVPIHMAAREGHGSLVKMFCEVYEVNPDTKVPCYDELEKSPLHVASSQGHAETVLLLIEECNADVNIRDSEGNTPLHHVVLQEYDPLGMKTKDDFSDTVKVLLNAGAEVNIQNGRGETAMHLAARNEFQKVIEVLVMAGCDPLLEDNSKNRAFDLVAEDDTVSKQIIKKAVEDRNKIMFEAPNVRARGFLTNFQRGANAYASSRSQSALNVSQVNNPKFSASYQNNNNNNTQNSRSNLTVSNVINAQTSWSSSNSSKRRSKESVNSGSRIVPVPRNQFDYAMSRRVKSVENLDSKQKKKSKTVHRDDFRSGYSRKNSYQESEATSMWSVTPPGSVQDVRPEHDSSGKHRSRKNPKNMINSQKTISESPEFRSKKKHGVRHSSASEDYYLDDEESVDMLDDRFAPPKEKVNRNDHVHKWMHNQNYFEPSDDESESTGGSSVTDDSESLVAEVLPTRAAKNRPAPPPKPAPSNKKYSDFKTSSNVDKVIQLEVDDNNDSGQTTIRVIPVNQQKSTQNSLVESRGPGKVKQPSTTALGSRTGRVEEKESPKPKQRQAKTLETKPTSRIDPNIVEEEDEFIVPEKQKAKKDVPQKKSNNLVFAKASTQSLDNLQHSNLARISSGDKAAPAKPSYSSAISPLLLNSSFDNSSKIIQQIQNKHQVLNSESSSRRMDTSQDENLSADLHPDVSRESQEDDDFNRIISFQSSASLPFVLVGGNKAGIYVDSIDQNSLAFKNGLQRADRILKVNSESVSGKAKEEVDQILRQCEGYTSLEVCKQTKNYNSVIENNGEGDHFYVKSLFDAEAQKNVDLNVRLGSVFLVVDTMPAGSPGFWKAKSVNLKNEETATGLIPNHQRAWQLITRKKLLDESSATEKSGSFFNSFRKAKSTERSRLNSSNSTDIESAASNVKAYERVALKNLNFCRPVVVLGLFCDVVINRLVKEYPDAFEKPQEAVENSQNEEQPVNTKVLRKSGKGRHALIILSPPSVEYLLHKTDLFPIVIYLSPVSKVVVKSIKNKLVPNYSKDSTYMFEEAVKFQTNYADLFTVVLDYTTDDRWFYNLREVILRTQNQPVWQPTFQEEEGAGGQRTPESEGRFPLEPALTRPSKSAKSSAANKRLSRTTDDLPTSSSTATSREFFNKVSKQNDEPIVPNRSARTKPVVQPRKVVKQTHETPL